MIGTLVGICILAALLGDGYVMAWIALRELDGKRKPRLSLVTRGLRAYWAHPRRLARLDRKSEAYLDS